MKESQADLSELVDRLATHRTLGSVPRDELEWLASHGTLKEFDAGSVVSSKDKSLDALYVMLSGHISISVDRGAGLHKVMEWRTGDVTGLLPYSRMDKPPGDSIAQERTVALSVGSEHFDGLIRECHQITSILVHVMLDRARQFTSHDLHDEKMVSLGRLSAGLAHELNNPAAAIERSALTLRDRLEDAERAARVLCASDITAEQVEAIDAARESCLATPVHGVRSPIEEAEREEAIAKWLHDHGLDASTAEPLAETEVNFEVLERLASEVEGPELNAVLRWTAAGCAVRSLATEIQDAALRISGLVMAIKGFTHMDQATVAQPVDLARGLDNTIAVLRSKARSKSVSVAVELEAELPPVLGFAGELNQIWGNLIDNALDAVPDSGRVEVRAQRDLDNVVVRIIDNGEGIPEGIKSRIFDPFFTTKPVGHGTGLGLDIVRRLVQHNDGEITVESEPGRTEFQVILPVADEEAQAVS